MHKKKRAWLLAFWAKHLPLWLLSKCKLISKGKYRTMWMEGLGNIFKGAEKEEALEAFHWINNTR